MAFWTIKPDWKGEDCFIIAGGTSVTQEMVNSVKGHGRTIVVNSSYSRALWADVLFFGDERWWTREVGLPGNKLASFPGVCATTSRAAKGDRLHRLHRIKPPPGLVDRPDSVVMERTSVQAAMNIAYHKRVGRIILLGLDNRDGDNGRTHHHDEYPWKRHKLTWDVKEEQLSLTVPILRAAGILVYNTSAISTIPFWPKRPLEDFIHG